MAALSKDLLDLPLPPGIMGLPGIGETLNFILDQNFAQKRHQEYGNVFKTQIFGSPTIFVKGGEAVRFLLANENKFFVNNLIGGARTLLGDHSLAVQTGATHINRRKLLSQAFAPRTLSTYATTIDQITDRYLDRWTNLKVFTWYPELRNYTFDIACKFLVGVDNGSQSLLGSLFERWSKGLFSFSPPLPWTNSGRAARAHLKMLSLIEKIIVERKQQVTKAEDALSLLINAQDEKGKGLSLEELKDQILLLLFAGHETLTSALSSFCLNLALHPEVAKRCRDEQTSIGFSTGMTSEALKSMSYLDKVLMETMRLVPPVGGGFRKVIKECQFQGYKFPLDWNVFYLINLTHADSSAYMQPEQFNPDRFDQDKADQSIKSYNYIPFGGGMRECIGREFARLEMKVFSSRLLQGYEWELLPKQNLDYTVIPVPAPKDGMKVNFRKI